MVVGVSLLFGNTVNARGGVFNRFSPEMLSNNGYGNQGGYHNYLQVTFKLNALFNSFCYKKWSILEWKINELR